MKRLIKPHYSKWSVLFALKRSGGWVTVYNVTKLDKGYGRMHGLMRDLDKAGLVNYTYDFINRDQVMRAKITDAGRDWVFNRSMKIISYLTAAFLGLLTLFFKFI